MAIVVGTTLPDSAHLGVRANIRIPASGAREIMLPPSASRNPGFERAPGAVGGNHQTTVETLGISGPSTKPDTAANPCAARYTGQFADRLQSIYH